MNSTRDGSPVTLVASSRPGRDEDLSRWTSKWPRITLERVTPFPPQKKTSSSPPTPLLFHPLFLSHLSPCCLVPPSPQQGHTQGWAQRAGFWGVCVGVSAAGRGLGVLNCRRSWDFQFWEPRLIPPRASPLGSVPNS